MKDTSCIIMEILAKFKNFHISIITKPLNDDMYYKYICYYAIQENIRNLLWFDISEYDL